MNHDLLAEERNLLTDLALHLKNVPVKCPYGFQRQAIYRMARLPAIPEEIMGILLAAGFRRYGDTVYTMGCENCRSCVPIKLDPFDFLPNRNQKRCVVRNRDLTTEISFLTPDQDAVTLLDIFFRERFPGKNNSAEDYYAGFFLNSAGFSAEIRYFLAGKLVGVSIIDVGRSWLSAVYFFFAPDLPRRSLGTFNILNLVDLCKTHDIRNLYLGYWIKEVKAMRYKAAFLPHYIFDGKRWLKNVGGGK